MIIDVGDLAAGDDRHRAGHFVGQKGQRCPCLGFEPHRIGPLGDLDQGAVEVEKQGVAPAIDREGQDGGLGHRLERNCSPEHGKVMLWAAYITPPEMRQGEAMFRERAKATGRRR
jgi:hypothetical protein